MNYEKVIKWLNDHEEQLPITATCGYVKNMMIASFKDLTSADIPSVLQSILSNPRILLTYYQENDALAIATLVSGAVTVIHYLSAEIFRDYSQVGK